MNKALKNALEKAGIRELNELQKRSYNLVKAGQSCLIVAPTGSGKTEAALIPLIEIILEKRLEGIALLYITPLRALNRDMLRRIEQIAREVGITISVRHGDTKESERRRQSIKPPQIMITTPETFQLLFLGKNLRKALKNVRFVVVDEVHEFADSERGAQLSVALERLREYTEFQIVALSATVGDSEKIRKYFKCDHVLEYTGEKRYNFSILKAENKEEDKTLASSMDTDPEIASELRLIKEICEKHNSVLIFVNTRQTAEALALKLKKIMNVEIHHGSLSRDVRVENERRFIAGEIKALICTSSLELGIDIGSVDCVIQYNSPREVGRLIQRVGRSGHSLEKVSKGIIVAGNFDDILESAVIVRKAQRKELEEIKTHDLSLDTLANQISAMAIEYGKISKHKAYGIIRRAYPFRRLSFHEFENICNFLAEVGVIFFDGNSISPRRRTRRFFYDNISMIPDEKHYLVKDITTGKTVGVLDESFLQTFSGELFAMKGEVWRVVGVDEIVRVVPAGVDAEIPRWLGEEIPVPYEVAIEVGSLRKIIADILKLKGYEKAVKFLVDNYSLNIHSANHVVRVIQNHVNSGYLVPTDSRIVIEGKDEIVTVNACFGHKINESLGRILALLVSARKGRNVGVEIDPYRIRLFPANTSEVKEVLLSLKELNREGIENIIERAVVDTKLFQWKIVNVARKMGFLGKDVDTNKINVRMLVQKLRDTPVFKEAMREIFVEKMDVHNLYKILREIDKFELVEYHSLTPIGSSSYRQSFDILFSSKPIEAVLDAFKERIERENTHILCLNCGFRVKVKVASVNSLICPRCKSKMVACVNAKRDLNEIDRKELFRIANLVSMHGKRAVYALNTYGIGVETASRILMRYYPDERSFLKALLEAEKNYIRSRAFWD